MTQHVVLAYGREVEYNRAIFAVLSFWAWYDGDTSKVATVVFTDRPDKFEPYLKNLPVQYVLITPVWLKKVIGRQGYIHRVKIAIVDQMFKNFHNDNVLFCDADTFFVASSRQLIEQIQVGVSVMYMPEWALSEVASTKATGFPKNPQKFIDASRGKSYRVGSEVYPYRKTQFMWNSGVLGLPNEVAELIPDIYTLNDTIYKTSEWVLTEQVAFSLVLETKTRLVHSSKYVFHYWDPTYKQIMDIHLKGLIANGLATMKYDELLTLIKKNTTTWFINVKRKKHSIDAIHAFSKGWILPGIKRTAYTFILGGFSVRFVKHLFNCLAKGIVASVEELI